MGQSAKGMAKKAQFDAMARLLVVSWKFQVQKFYNLAAKRNSIRQKIYQCWAAGIPNTEF